MSQRKTAALRKVLAIVGGQRELARKLGISQSSVWGWLHTTKQIPAERVREIERLVDYKITAEQMRPDVFK